MRQIDQWGLRNVGLLRTYRGNYQLGFRCVHWLHSKNYRWISNPVFIIRLAERKIDELLDTALLDYSSLGSEFESVQFESEQWSFLRPFTGKKKAVPPPTSTNSTIRGPPSPLPIRPPSPSPSVSSFSSIRQSFRARASSSTTTPLQALFSENSQTPSPSHLTSYLTALHTFLTLSDINPALITQLWSQVMYWTSSEYEHTRAL